MIWALWVIPFVIALSAPVLARYRRALPVVSLGGLAVVIAASLWGAATETTGGWSWGPRFALSFDLTGFGRAMAVLVPSVAAPIVAFALATERAGRTRLVALLVAFVGAMELLVAAGDFLTLLIAWELVGAFSWTLIAHSWRDSGAVGRATHAFITTRMGDLGLYAAAGLAFAATGSLSFRALDDADRGAAGAIALGVLVAAAAKSAQLPFSPWLFSAMAGPTPVSALLHSATMVAAGAYILIRLGPTFDAVSWFGPAVTAVGLTTAIAGGVVAAAQTHAKRLLAGSTSAQYGLMFVAVGVGSTAAAGVHLAAHAAAKALLFLGAGVAIHAAATADVGRMRLGRALPLAAGMSAVGALAIAAVPPLGAAWTKDQIAAAALHSSGWLGSFVLVAGMMSAFYAGRYQILAFGRNSGEVLGTPRPGRTEIAALGALSAISIALGILWWPGSGAIVERITRGALADGAVWEVAAALLGILVAAAFIFVLSARTALVSLGAPPPLRQFAAGWFGLPTASRVLLVDPVLRLARWLARFDDRIVDAGVRAAASLAASCGRLLAWRGELSMDGVVRGVAAGTLFAARGSRATDERGIDGSVEGIAHAVGYTGTRSRRLQTGLSHHYYVAVTAGLLIVVGVLAFAR